MGRTTVLACALVDLERLDRALREWLDALGPAPRVGLLQVLMRRQPPIAKAAGVGGGWSEREGAMTVHREVGFRR
jgi:hypothetical protein